MQRSPEIAELFAALAKAQGTYESATKDQLNPHFGRRYSDLASGWNAVRAALSANGLSVIQDFETVENGVEIETLLGHSSGQWVSSRSFMPAARQDAQGIGGAVTYGRRYSLFAICGIAPEDDDGNAAVDPGKGPERPAVRAPQQQQRPAQQGTEKPRDPSPTAEQLEEYRTLAKGLGLTAASAGEICRTVAGCAPGQLTAEGMGKVLADLRTRKAGGEAPPSANDNAAPEASNG